jgi:hypothetical protein
MVSLRRILSFPFLPREIADVLAGALVVHLSR